MTQGQPLRVCAMDQKGSWRLLPCSCLTPVSLPCKAPVYIKPCSGGGTGCDAFSHHTVAAPRPLTFRDLRLGSFER
jgi:hypothetical protein